MGAVVQPHSGRAPFRPLVTADIIAADLPIGVVSGDAIAQGDGPARGREIEIADLLAFIKHARDLGFAVEAIRALLGQVGLRSWHAGPLANSAATEAMTSLLIQINRRYKIAHGGIRITGAPKDAA